MLLLAFYGKQVVSGGHSGMLFVLMRLEAGDRRVVEAAHCCWKGEEADDFDRLEEGSRVDSCCVIFNACACCCEGSLAIGPRCCGGPTGLAGRTRVPRPVGPGSVKILYRPARPGLWSEAFSKPGIEVFE